RDPPRTPRAAFAATEPALDLPSAPWETRNAAERSSIARSATSVAGGEGRSPALTQPPGAALRAQRLAGRDGKHGERLVRVEDVRLGVRQQLGLAALHGAGQA